MQGARILTGGPQEFGPTGPPHISVFVVTVGGTHLNVAGDPALADLRSAVNSDNPLMMAAENANIYYAWASVGSGTNIDPGMTVYGPTGINQCGVLFANTRTFLPEQAPHGANGLKLSAGTGATAIFRIWSTG
jgi:hypothetical protein